MRAPRELAVSAIIPADEHGAIGETLNSVFGQKFTHLQVVVNDGSPDAEELERIAIAIVI